MIKKNEGYAFTFNKQAFVTDQRFVDQTFLRKFCNVPDDQLIYLDIEGRDEPLNESEDVDLARDEVETFYSMPKNQVHQLSINKTIYEWKGRYINNEQIRELGRVPVGQSLYFSIQGDDELIKTNQVIDLGRLGVEEFYSLHVQPKDRMFINIETAKGKWLNQEFPETLTIGQLIQQIIAKFQFATDGNYQLKVKGGDTLAGNVTLKGAGLQDGATLCFTDLGKGA